MVYKGLNAKGKHELSRKALLEERGVKPREGGYGSGGGGGRTTESSSKPRTTPAPEMTKEEVDVIAKAIDNANATD